MGEESAGGGFNNGGGTDDCGDGMYETQLLHVTLFIARPLGQVKHGYILNKRNVLRSQHWTSDLDIPEAYLHLQRKHAWFLLYKR